MEKLREQLESNADRLKEVADEINRAEETFMCQYDTMSQLFFEEKKLLLAQMDAMRKHYGKIILTISLTLLLVIGSLIGGLIYLISNYDIAYEVYQDVSAEGGGDSTVEDGIHLNGTPVEK